MMSKISCGDRETWNIAKDGLFAKYGKHMSDYVKKAYFSSPNCLGGHCSKTPGEPISTNAPEARGGEQQKALKEVLGHFADPDAASTNPVHMMAAVARDHEFHSEKNNRVAKFAIIPSRLDSKDKFYEKALEALRYLSKYRAPKTISSNSRKVQQVNNLSSTWLYSSLTSGGGEEVPFDILGKENQSIEWTFATASRDLTSLKKIKLAQREARLSGPAAMHDNVVSEEDLSDVEKLSGMFRTLTIGERKQLKADLVKRRLSNTVEMKPWECVATYLLRRAHRNADSDALEIMTTLKHEKAAEKKSAQKKKGKKKPAAKSYDEVRAEQLVLDKDAGETCDDDAAIGKPPTTANPQYQSEFMQIDGEGGALQAALEDTSDDVDDYDDDLCEKRSDRVVMKRELGDFNQVKYDAATGIICCDCETFNRLGDCPHRVYVEVLHLKEYPDGNANEQWQVMREKMISNLSTQCGALLED